MPNLLDIANRAKAKVDELRHSYTPDKSKRSYKRYAWFCNKTHSWRRGNEGFCRYWRVAWIYAPLLKAAPYIFGTVGAFAFIVLATIFATHLNALFALLALIGIAVYIVCGGYMGKELVYAVYDGDQFGSGTWLAYKPLWVKVALTLPVAPIAGFVFGGFSLMHGLLVLQEDHQFFTKIWHFLVDAHFAERRPWRWLRAWLALEAILVGLAFTSWVGAYLLWVSAFPVGITAFSRFLGWTVRRQRQRELASVQLGSLGRVSYTTPVVYSRPSAPPRAVKRRTFGRSLIDNVKGAAKLVWTGIVFVKNPFCPKVNL
ncbi:MAG TPA: hypothetical protein VLF91_06640 [Candidatus Saccharimonadales bacterium]|nr:hypothetical protein [Candidatus Saccharimonadales bacterium]